MSAQPWLFLGIPQTFTFSTRTSFQHIELGDISTAKEKERQPSKAPANTLNYTGTAPDQRQLPSASFVLPVQASPHMATEIPPDLRQTTPDIVPVSPPQGQPQYVWYPGANQQHYSIVIGSRSKEDGKGTSRYVITERQDRGGVVTSPSGTIQEASRLSPVSPWNDIDPTSHKQPNENNNKFKVLQKPPANAKAIFRPRRARSRRPTTDRKRDTNKHPQQHHASSTFSLEKRQDSPIHANAAADAVHETRDTTIANNNNNNNFPDNDNQQKDTSEESREHWEPIPWKEIWDGSGKPIEEDLAASAELASFLAPSFSLTPPSESNTFRPIPRGSNAYWEESHNRYCVPHAPWNPPTWAYPCPVSPVARPEKPTNDSFPTIISPELETARRLAASDQWDEDHQALPTTAHGPPKRPWEEYMADHRPYKFSRWAENRGDGNQSASPSPPPTWPKDSPLLDEFWKYCANVRPHLLPTLRSTVSSCQTKLSEEDKDHNSSLASIVMEDLVREWGGPLLGEVYRRVLSTMEQADHKKRAGRIRADP